MAIKLHIIRHRKAKRNNKKNHKNHGFNGTATQRTIFYRAVYAK